MLLRDSATQSDDIDRVFASPAIHVALASGARATSGAITTSPSTRPRMTRKLAAARAIASGKGQVDFTAFLKTLKK